ncbi:PspC domain-containing protein [Aquimarina longa]|uniref:PspC domain-containing protein n=1 Tax=Aquimarina longa TaxID=1080221 RepID=UPI000784B2CA|nr:PspC domain-containing protein [Aquimarina longa]
MNKTVNINLAGIFFHIDENAYLKLQRYLNAIKRSFTDSQGRDEIIADIEARIAELFSEKIKDERQVIGNKEVEEVIDVMGQPEDYRLDEEIFEDDINTPLQKPKTSKQLFRDTTNSYIGGVSSGLGNYFGIDTIWIRLAWILFTIFSSGAFILIYIAFWIFVKEAKTTADFLAMKGEAVTIGNIEKKIKEGLNDVTDTVKSVDYQKYSSKVKSSSTTFFEALGDVFLFFLKAFSKFAGIFLILFFGATLIGLFIGLFTIGTFGFMDTPWTEYFEVSSAPEVPLWVMSLLGFLAIGIPCFFLFIIGLKILIKNLKSIGKPTKLGLLGVWILSIIGLVILGIRQATLEAYDAEVIIEKKMLPITHNDTLTIKMVGNNRYTKQLGHRHNYKIKRDDQGNRVIVIQDIEVYLKAATIDSTVSIAVEKKAEGKSYDEALKRAKDLKYTYTVEGNTLLLNGYAITDYVNKYRSQEVKVILTLPEGITVFADDNTSEYNNTWTYDDYITIDGKEEYFNTLINGKLECEQCPDNENDWEYHESDDDGININLNSDENDFKLKINEDGVELNNEPVKVKIDENGIEIKTKK